jgi:hypothetical protein
MPENMSLAEFFVGCKYLFSNDIKDVETTKIIKSIIGVLFDIKKPRALLKTPPPIKRVNKFSKCEKVSKEAKTMKLKREYNEKYLIKDLEKITGMSKEDDVDIIRNIIYKIKEYVDDLTLISNMSFTDRLNLESINPTTPPVRVVYM